MAATEGILLILVLLLVVLVCQQARSPKRRPWYAWNQPPCGWAEGFQGGGEGFHQRPRGAGASYETPYYPLQAPPGTFFNGIRHDPLPGPPGPLMSLSGPKARDGPVADVGTESWGLRGGYGSDSLAKNYRSWAAGPRDIDDAERAAWFETAAGQNPPPYYATHGGFVQPDPDLNYQDMLVDLIADPRMRAQQANWWSEVAPKSQTSMKVDTVDEAASIAAFQGHGIYAFRFGAPAQHNPLHLTDSGPADFAAEATEFMIGG
jgi:hypothetical protein